MIRIENLVKRYGDVVALDHFNLEVKEGLTARERRQRSTVCLRF